MNKGEQQLPRQEYGRARLRPSQINQTQAVKDGVIQRTSCLQTCQLHVGSRRDFASAKPLRMFLKVFPATRSSPQRFKCIGTSNPLIMKPAIAKIGKTFSRLS